MLYIVPTPIGNLKDITLRALEVLKEADGIICEDTRRTSLLLSHYQIKKPLLTLNDYNEAKELPRIVSELLEGRTLVLVSDAGTPLIADPGYKLVRECLAQNILVDSLPGPSSVITALTLSGLPPDKFMFLGYPPEKASHRIKLFQNILDREHNENLKATYIMFISPHKLLRTLEDTQEIFGDAEVCLAHELTKIHQSVETKLISKWLEKFNSPSGGPKGEYILLFRLKS
ncbi:16S rRNA (cytidine(1402)-2'-O)-methyltransferase [Candidatus Daviesbacteria bacterium RIFCSPLOWO2_02_FULL_41_8]|uniref:Ribosomal RNA small subunit methyltransferase I n=3 Tax=Candidatus Daviesiibacteriota TaxID=1752718 RepID=A0A1F5NLJ5_9BACT|nr:MAG: 16S rRNA (cytidine(1402)-2'-O)-methyltransferase [Candidatus Daviesbacteria bacterium RIFCSPHIGHO2_01_FULL_41_23]OGE33660.1 MAG: 16S rRNA (cytidine(1402)-2'-O)-methyltransferase [Candidatus Daviesbacteria bacterium RIFCSPHIGHO2_02_FULL_41_10]OGE61914.1 MAG: 16S rRNA (cytidine(1402)-2'-O)-methyltransferase [Candidatus Daviesbacteria bacterium RIFCSPLOWO2_01_FULL_41_32]OGE78567.1 MAG: 16S rRNA (cytidine(1402)-2'-O)-methyltransferase [Candidatus Daviesbacteria bacterium RIFCSPLOWO2_02_FULL_